MNLPIVVVAVDRVKASSLVGFSRVGYENVKVGGATPWESLQIKVPSYLKIESSIVSGVRVHSAQLVLKCCTDNVTDFGKRIYRCTTSDGKKILIGTDGRPFPVTTSQLIRPDNMKDSMLMELTVNYSSPSPIPYIL